MSQKVVQYQAVMQMAQANPQIYDLPELNKQKLEILGVKNIGKLIPSAEDQKPKDPVSENMAIINGKPVKAFMFQDHQAHIAVHTAFMQNPKITEMVGQNPMAQQIQAAAFAHINEHVAFEYRKQLEEQLGVPLPKPDETLPEDVEFELSKLMAEASQKLLQKDQSAAQQQQIQQQQQDPLIQMQQQELAIKQQEVQIKQQKTLADIEIDKGKLMLEAKKLESSEKIAGVEIGAKSTYEKLKFEGEQKATGIKLGIDAASKIKEDELKKEQLNIQRESQKSRE
jgi:hypothetical protein